MTLVDTGLYAAVLVGVCAAGFIVARSPAFWLGLVMLVIQKTLPFVIPLLKKLIKPYDAATQEKLDEARRQGQDWDPIRKEPRRR